jgi:hypothetical protein
LKKYALESRFLPGFFSLLTPEIYTAVSYLKTVTLPDIDAAFEYTCCMQITETPFLE